MSEYHPNIAQLCEDLDVEARGWIVMDGFAPAEQTIGFVSLKMVNHIAYVTTLNHDAGQYSVIIEEADEKAVKSSTRESKIGLDRLSAVLKAHLG